MESTQTFRTNATFLSLEYDERKKMYAKLIDSIGILIVKEPKVGIHYYNRGKVNFVNLNMESAITDFKMSAKLNYQKKKAYEYLSDIYSITDQSDSADYYWQLSRIKDL